MDYYKPAGELTVHFIDKVLDFENLLARVFYNKMKVESGFRSTILTLAFMQMTLFFHDQSILVGFRWVFWVSDDVLYFGAGVQCGQVPLWGLEVTRFSH